MYAQGIHLQARHYSDKLWGIKSKLAKKDRAPYYPCAFVCFALWPAAIY